MGLPWWIEAVLLLLTGTGGLAGAQILFRRILQWVARRKWTNSLEAEDGIYSILNDVCGKLKAQRAVLLLSRNGGGVPRPGFPLFITVLRETYVTTQRPIKEGWIDRHVDQSFTRKLLELFNYQHLRLETDSLPEASVLRDSFIAAETGVCFFQTVGMRFDGFLKVHPVGFVYLSVSFSDKTRQLTPQERERLRSASVKLRVLMRLATAKPPASLPDQFSLSTTPE